MAYSNVPYLNYRLGLICSMSERILSLEQEKHIGYYLYRIVETRIYRGVPTRFFITPWMTVRRMRAVLDGIYCGMLLLLEEEAVEDRGWIKRVFRSSRKDGER